MARDMVSDKALAHALAYIAISGHDRFLHRSTWRAALPFVRSPVALMSLDFDAHPTERLDLEGLQKARRSPLWKAHEHLTGMGWLPARIRPGVAIYLVANDAISPWTIVRRSGKVEMDGEFYRQFSYGEPIEA